MVGSNTEDNSSPGNWNTNTSTEDFLRMARVAVGNAQPELAAHLYLCAYEQDKHTSGKPTATGLAGLRKSWSLALDLKDRALAEHIFEKLMPNSSPEANDEYSRQLQRLAMERLEEFGLSAEELEEMANFLSEEDNSGFAQLRSSFMPHAKKPAAKSSGPSKQDSGILLPPSPFAKIRDRSQSPAPTSPREHAKREEQQEEEKALTFSELVGYDDAIAQMKRFGIGNGNDERFNGFLDMLSHRHGISSLPAMESIVFRSEAREDATYFMHATAGEMAFPTIRMYMETSVQGMAMLCIMASEDFKPRGNLSRMSFDAPTVLILEDIDLWAEPLSNGEEDGFEGAQLARGAKEALVFVRAAVDNPNVTVMASCALDGFGSPFVYDMLDPMTFVDIELPNREERAAIWRHAVNLYPSMQLLDLEDMVRFSEGMTRYDIYGAAREAVEQAYRESVSKHAYVPVTSTNLLDKIAAFQPLDSKVFAEIQDILLEGFRHDLEHIDDIFNEGF